MTKIKKYNNEKRRVEEDTGEGTGRKGEGRGWKRKARKGGRERKEARKKEGRKNYPHGLNTSGTTINYLQVANNDQKGEKIKSHIMTIRGVPRWLRSWKLHPLVASPGQACS